MSTTELATPTRECRGPQAPQTRRPRRRGDERDQLRKALADSYNAGASIRALADEHDMSYGLTRTLLREAGVQLRTRRGTRTPKKAEQ